VGAASLVTVICGILAIALLLYAALHDLAARTVPNWLPLCMLALGIVARLMDHTLETGLIIAAATFAVLFAIWVLGYMGGGDVKLWAATALLIPPQLRPELNFFLLVFVLGGLLGLIYLAMWPLLRRRLVRRRRAALAGVPMPMPPAPPRGLLRRALRAEAWRIGRRGPLPYACAIAAGAIMSLLPVFPQL